MVDAWGGLVVCHSSADLGHCRGRSGDAHAQPVFLAWPFVAAALIFGLFAWWLYDDNRAERSLLNAVVAAMFLPCYLWHRAAGADAAVSERRDRARAAQCRLRRAEGCCRRLSGA